MYILRSRVTWLRSYNKIRKSCGFYVLTNATYVYVIRVVDYLKDQGFHVFMPAEKGKRPHLTVEEANASRFVTKVCWAVEAVHGAISEKHHLLHNVLDNKLLPVVESLCRIAGFLNNCFGKRLNSVVEF